MADIKDMEGLLGRNIIRAARDGEVMCSVNYGEHMDYSVARSEVAILEKLFSTAEETAPHRNWSLDCKNHSPPVLYINPKIREG